MIYKIKNIIIDPENPFENDKLDRRPHVKNIATLLSNAPTSFVLSVNASWGTGKTTFLKMLKCELPQQHKTVFFSAWETDFVEDPLLVFLGEINSALESLAGKDKIKIKALKTVKEMGKKVLINVIPTGIKLATAGLIDIKDEVKEGISAATELLSHDLVESYLQNKTAIEKFKENISKILDVKNGDRHNIYIFVDELDRCRPTYAVELLERVKHLFDIDGLVFVLAIDKKQLAHSVKAIYGSEFDAEGYLKRFIDIDYNLPEPNVRNYVEYLFECFDFEVFFNSRKKYRDFEYEVSEIKNSIELFAIHKKMSLRDVEQLFTKLKLVVLATEGNVFLYPIMLMFLLFTKTYYSDIYFRFIKNPNSPSEIIELIHQIIPEEELFASNECFLIEGYLLRNQVSTPDRGATSIISAHRDNIANENLYIKSNGYSESVLEVINGVRYHTRSINFSNLISRIEMLKAFNFEIKNS